MVKRGLTRLRVPDTSPVYGASQHVGNGRGHAPTRRFVRKEHTVRLVRKRRELYIPYRLGRVESGAARDDVTVGNDGFRSEEADVHANRTTTNGIITNEVSWSHAAGRWDHRVSNDSLIPHSEPEPGSKRKVSARAGCGRWTDKSRSGFA